MRNLIDFSIMHEYNKNVLPRGDKLLSIAGLVECKRFSHIADGLYKNNTERGGRPNIDVIIIRTYAVDGRYLDDSVHPNT
ncbi:MAG: hypothetical protein NUK54_07590, partial [Methanothrix sp.]|nr:hypothetical protein [Methanothrix sp.]